MKPTKFIKSYPLRFKGLLFGAFLSLASCGAPDAEKYELSSSELSYIAIDSRVLPADSVMDLMIAPYRDSLNKEMNQVIGTLPFAVDKGEPSGPLNNFVPDMLLEEATRNLSVKPDFCLLNYGGLRYSLPQGNITRNDVFQLMPFENELVVVKVNPQGMKMLFEYLYNEGTQPVSALMVKFGKEGSYTAKVAGKPWNPKASYYILTNDYLLKGGDQMNFFALNDTVIHTNILIRDAIFQYFSIHQSDNKILKIDTLQRIFY
jgi:2',3'-cyclic-nucleotide 2'-phosphodiesterase (5'-nucleotidase family)